MRCSTRRLSQACLLRNPFKKRSIKVAVGTAKKQEVKEASILTVIDHCPTLEWKLLFAFARWIGSRIPSEIENLTWDRVDWERSAILITSPKTAYPGKGERLVPIFPEVYELLERQSFVFDEGVPLVFPTLRLHTNLAATAKKWVKKATLPVWTVFFNTLRANRETDLMDSHGIRTACSWIGNTPTIAMKNYSTQKGSDFDDSNRSETVIQKATPKTMQKAMQHGRKPASMEEMPMSEEPIKQGINENWGAPQEPINSRDGTRTRTPLTGTGF